jgi:hypothetical protein
MTIAAAWNPEPPHLPSFVGHPLPKGEGCTSRGGPGPLRGERVASGASRVRGLDQISATGQHSRFSEFSNFHCHPGKAGGTPVALARVINGTMSGSDVDPDRCHSLDNWSNCDSPYS